ncbi:MAG: hypothetical protein OEY01_14060 [Desulfobulbaceae bacterium]|nr:hypothetical protein [Desulfobulbaceae bacterium]HIJ79827.1 hypothetical protein [Deltaproteobacteria bacterium]
MRSNRPNIQDVLAYEIKKEIAERYFGFRKLIETDKLNFQEKTRQYSFILEKRISFDLIRIYILLGDEGLIHEFLSLTNLPADLFYDPYLTKSATIRARVFEGISLHGFTRKRRLKNLFFACYDRLAVHIEQYRDKLKELSEDRENINEEIELFYQKNDISSIVGFLKALGDHSKTGHMEGGMEPGMAQGLAQKMRIENQLPVDHYLPTILSLPARKQIDKDLRQLISQAIDRHQPEFIELFSRRDGWALR